MQDVLYKQAVVYRALEELDERLYRMNVHPFELNVVGGFALLLEQIRVSDYTDIDYIGEDLNQKIKDIVDEIGIEYGLGRGWVNNDVLMAGSSLEELEFTTGVLVFKPALQLRVITVNSLEMDCVLRMKVIAIDTSYAGTEYGGDFTRVKDFPDVKLLMEHLGWSYKDLVEETFDYVESPEIYFLIRYYLNYGDFTRFDDRKFCMKVIETKGKERIS